MINFKYKNGKKRERKKFIKNVFIKKNERNNIKKDINKLDEQPGSKLSKDSTILSKMSNLPLNINLKNINSEIFSNCPFNVVKLPIDIEGQLKNISELIVKQEADISEIFFSCCCQQPNNYHVYSRELNGHLNYIYKLREFSGACNRFFIPVNCREFTMKMKIITDKKKKGDKDFSDSLITIQKDFKIPCLCLIRPEMVVNLAKEKTLIGRVENNFSIFDPTFTIYNEEDEVVKYIEASCCQWGYLFRNYSCGKSEDCKFLIYNSKEKNKPIGHIVKKTESVYSLGDNYHVVFPDKTPPEEKFLLSIVAVLIDYQYYEKNNEVIK